MCSFLSYSESLKQGIFSFNNLDLFIFLLLLWCSALPALLRRPSIASSLAHRELALLWLRISFVMFIFEF